ncbi:MAG: calcineurin-like phosphoesterase family protein [Prolixibacteraceae bacterium]|nr:calcineurin-like phosphoesterase family protein [Prolixibacteraceae bacterium]
MKLRLICLYFFICLSSSVFSQDFVSGIVFLDGNSNGTFDAAEKGIKGICVSNGAEVIQTNSDGKWTLPVGNETNLFVVKPANYAVPLNSDKIPQHFFLYKKSDSVASTTSVNFPLVKSEEPKKFSALFFGDTQTRGLKEVNYINHDVVEECIGTNAIFGVSLGDITADGPALFNEINHGIAQIGIPWYNTFGNHDFDREAKNTDEKDATFKRIYGPSTYAFEYGQVVFIDFNNIYFKPDGKYIPHFTDSQISFVKNYLEFVPKNKLVVLIMHAPIVMCDNKEQIFDLISDRKYTFSISGHAHEQLNLFVDKKMGWKGTETHHHLVNATVCGSWWCGLNDELGIPHATMNDGAPNGYSVITFDGANYSVRFKAARRPENYQMNIYLPEEIKISELDTTKILVNVFAGSARSKVEMCIDNFNVWRPLQQVKAIDPEILRMHKLSSLLQKSVDGQSLEDSFGYSMDSPSKSDHMWQTTLPKEIASGTHTVTVKTTDMFGQVFQASRVFRIP